MPKKNRELENAFDRLSGLDVDSQLSRDDLDVDFKKNKDLNKFILAGQHAPRQKENLSEIGDPIEKDAVFNHTINNGVFRNINNSPLRDRLPKSMQMYTSDNKNDTFQSHQQH